MGFNELVLTESMTKQRIGAILHYTLAPLQNVLASPLKAATSDNMTVLSILRALNGISAQTADAVDGMDEIYSPSQTSLTNLAMQLNFLDTDSPDIQPCAHRDSAWNWLAQIAMAPESNIWFLFGVLYGLIVNIMTNQCVLRDSGLGEEIVGTLKVAGTIVVNEMASSRVEEHHESRLGFVFVSECLRDCVASKNHFTPPICEWFSVFAAKSWFLFILVFHTRHKSAKSSQDSQ